VGLHLEVDHIQKHQGLAALFWNRLKEHVSRKERLFENELFSPILPN